MTAKAISRNLRISPRKMRLVADLVRGLNVNDALVQLQLSPKRSATPVFKAVKSAVANWKQADGVDHSQADELVITRIWVDEGPTQRRYLPRAQGRATLLRKRSSHLTVEVGSLTNNSDTEE